MRWSNPHERFGNQWHEHDGQRGGLGPGGAPGPISLIFKDNGTEEAEIYGVSED